MRWERVFECGVLVRIFFDLELDERRVLWGDGLRRESSRFFLGVLEGDAGRLLADVFVCDLEMGEEVGVVNGGCEDEEEGGGTERIS